MINESDKIQDKIKRFENLAWIFIWVGVVFFASAIVFYYCYDKEFNEVGDYIGGTSGSLWALAGLFFIYVAFLGQKLEIKMQKEDLQLTRDELRDSREVFKAQAEIMKNQKLDATFFNLLDNHRKLIESFNSSIGKEPLEYIESRKYLINDVDIVSGYDVLERIRREVRDYLIEYSNFLKTNFIFDNNITKTNPIKFIESKSEIKRLFFEVSNIVNWIYENVETKKGQEFYYATLSSNLSEQEKFLIEVYNANFLSISNSNIHFGEYDKFDFSSFICETYINHESIRVISRNEPFINKELITNYFLEIKTASSFSSIELFFYEKKSKNIVELGEVEPKNLILITSIIFNDIIKKLDIPANDLTSSISKDFNLLIKANNKKGISIFYLQEFSLYIDNSLINPYKLNTLHGKSIPNWIKEKFTQKFP